MENKDWEMGVSSGDWHVPFVDNKALDLFLYFIKQEQPKYVVLNGDIMDCWEVSKFDKVPRSGATLQNEIDEVHDLLKLVRKICPNAKIVYVEGNHEFRLKKYIIVRSPELYKLSGWQGEDRIEMFDIPRLLDCHYLGVDYIPSREGLSRFGHNWWQIGSLYIGHFDRVSKHAGYTAKNLLTDLGVSLIQSHTHRFGMSSVTFLDRDLVAVEQGCLCDLNPNYVVGANWQHGFSVFYKKTNSDRFQIYPVRIPDYEFNYGGVWYTPEEARKLYSDA